MICSEYQGCGRYSDEYEWDSRDAMIFNGEPEPHATQQNLRYLSTATPEEFEVLAICAYGHLTSGWWEGEGTVVEEFLEGCADGHRAFSEGMLDVYAHDLAGELRILRGWCPHAPYDKRSAGEFLAAMTG